ncbi:class III signal peptide-containing protein [Thermococcus litoralis]|uniref:class III signal peptide-containing protein n=1 Tax=Thermococcus litoralis TaxID=2265 RepID=UPI000B35EB1D|nr:class III signal peptide-containing protein [Thermococcus litoralis]
MINLKKLFRRKKGQGALEYLFMIAAALIIIFVVVRYISGTGQQATSQGDLSVLQIQADLAKAKMEAVGIWNANYLVQYDNDNGVVTIVDTDNTTVATLSVPSDYQDAVSTYLGSDDKSLGTVYNDCMAGNINACRVLALYTSSSS